MEGSQSPRPPDPAREKGSAQDRLRRAFQIETVGIVFFDTAGHITDANDAFLRMSGYDRDDVARGAVRWDAMTPPEFMPASRKALEELKATGRSEPYEKQYIRKDGSRLWALFAATMLSEREGVEFVIDISESRRAQAALRETELRFRTLVQNVRDYAIFMIDPRGYITEWTEGAQRVTGYTAEEAIGQNFSIFYTPEGLAAGEVDRELAEAAQHGRAERDSWRVRKGGERFWGNEIATAIRDDQGNLLGFTKITRDLSEKKQIQDALRDREEQYRLLIESIRDHAIFMTDAQGRVLTWSHAAHRIFGYDEKEIIGKGAATFFTPEDRAAGEHEKELATALAEGRASDDRWQMRKGGQRFWASGVTSTYKDAAGNLRGFVKVCRDLTEQKQVQDQRDRLLEQEKIARLEAERAMTLRDEFLAIVSHELRTPLTAILLWARMLRSGTVKVEEYAEAFEAIEHGARAQQQLVEDLLDMSRIISGKLRLNIRPAELVPVVQAATEAVRPMAEAKGVQLELSLPRDVGPVAADPDRIQQVMWNLLNNAVKFTGRGGSVRVRLERGDSELRIVVADTGIGISPEFLPHVFERFRQFDASTTRSHGGLGLGLAIVRQLVELHGGMITAESPGAGRGATFTVELPMAEPLRREHPSYRQSGRRAAAGEPSFCANGALSGLRVLLVDDDQNTLSAVRWLLQQCQAQVTALDSAAQAVATFRQSLGTDGDGGGERFDVLVSDIGMPVQDGFELLREVRELERRREQTQPIPAVALTAYARNEDRQRALAAGFKDHVTKPVEPQALIRAVASASGRAIER